MLVDLDKKTIAPLVFEDAGKVFSPDACEPLKQAADREEVELQGWARGNYPGLRIPSGVLPGVRSIGVWDAHKRQSWGLGEHCNEGIEISYLSRGQLSYASSGTQTLLHSGDMTVTAPWLVHEVGLPNVEASRLVWIILDVGVRRPNQKWVWPDWVVLTRKEKEQLSNVIQNSDRTVWPGRALTSVIDEIIDILHAGGPEDKESDAKIAINALLLRLARTVGQEHDHPCEPRDRALETVRLFLGRLEEHIDYPWRVDEMAEQCGIPRGAFITNCRNLLNRTPHAHLMRLRIKCACRLLEEAEQKSLTDIAMECGFSSSAHFSAAFRKEFGQTPSSYRTNYTSGNVAAE